MNTRRPRSTDTTRCPRCGAPTYRELVGGNRLALNVTADTTPLPLDQALADAGPNQLVWCLTRRAEGSHRLAWYTPHAHPITCTAHVLDHRCPRPPPATSTTPAAQQPHLF